MITALRVLALLALAALLLALMLPVFRRSRPMRALRSAVRRWLRPANEPRSRLVRRCVGCVVGIVTFVQADSTSSAAAAYVLATARVLIYGI